MFLRELKVKQNGKCYTYLKVVESAWVNGRTVQHTLVNLGNVTQWPPERLEELVRSLTRLLESDLVLFSDVDVKECRQLGPYLPLEHLWNEMDLEGIIHKTLRDRKIDIHVGACTKVLVFQRLVDPKSKLRTWESLPREAEIPGIDPSALPLHSYYWALEYLSEAKVPIEKALHARVRDLFNQDVSLVFYDLTSTYFEGDGCSMAKKGYSRDHRPDLLQVGIGLLVDQEGIPIGHEVFDGNIKDVTTVVGQLRRLKNDFGLTRCVFVGDDGMASEKNLEEVEREGFEYITSLSLRKSLIGEELVAQLPSWRTFEQLTPNLRMMPLRKVGRVRFIATYNTERAKSNQRHRKERLRQCLCYLKKLDTPPKGRGRKVTPAQRLETAHNFVRRKECHRFLHVSQTPEGGLQWELDRRAVRQEHRMDGLMILKTNSTTLDDKEVSTGYRTLWRAEDAFRHLKGPLELRPIRHWRDPRVLGHIMVCVLAYTMERLLERKLEKAQMDTSAARALEELRPIQAVTLEAGDHYVRRRSQITPRQNALLAAMGVHNVPQIW